MADVEVQNETPVQNEVEETAESLKKDAAESEVAENGSATEEKENGDATEEKEDGDEEDAEKDEEEETNGDSTDAPEAVKRKVDDAKVEESATPEKKAKLSEETSEKEVNGAEAEVAAAEA